MRNKIGLFLATGVALASIAGSAAAAITVSNSVYETYAGDLLTFAQSNVVCDFSSPVCLSGYSFAFAGGTPTASGIFTTSIAGVTADPPGDTTPYASIEGPNGVGTLTLSVPTNSISFFMGSPDTYNSISFLNGASTIATFAGSAFTGPPANGDQPLGERITFNFGGAAVTSVQFTSSQNAFEFDRIGVVQEPETWALMIMGFGGVGALVRSCRRQAATA